MSHDDKRDEEAMRSYWRVRGLDEAIDRIVELEAEKSAQSMMVLVPLADVLAAIMEPCDLQWNGSQEWLCEKLKAIKRTSGVPSAIQPNADGSLRAAPRKDDPENRPDPTEDSPVQPSAPSHVAPMAGTWAKDDPRRAFVEGGKWVQFQVTGATSFPSEVDDMEKEAAKRYAPVSSTRPLADRLASELATAVALFENDPECQKVGTDAWVWLQAAMQALRDEEAQPSAIEAWRPMLTAPLDGTEIEVMFRHFTYWTALKVDGKEEAEKRWQAVQRAKWIDHNGGGWTWHGMAGSPVAWRPINAATDGGGAK